MNRLGITEGEWKAKSSPNYHDPKASKIEIHSRMSQGWIAKVQDNGVIRHKEGLSNAKLIADAGTTANKCGLLPSELLEQRDELLEALQKMCEYHEKMATWDKGDNGYYSAKKLIQKIETTK